MGRAAGGAAAGGKGDLSFKQDIFSHAQVAVRSVGSLPQAASTTTAMPSWDSDATKPEPCCRCAVQ
jgi:hypothetical protein